MTFKERQKSGNCCMDEVKRGKTGSRKGIFTKQEWIEINNPHARTMIIKHPSLLYYHWCYITVLYLFNFASSFSCWVSSLAYAYVHQLKPCLDPYRQKLSANNYLFWNQTGIDNRLANFQLDLQIITIPLARPNQVMSYQTANYYQIMNPNRALLGTKGLFVAQPTAHLDLIASLHLLLGFISSYVFLEGQGWVHRPLCTQTSY